MAQFPPLSNDDITRPNLVRMLQGLNELYLKCLVNAWHIVALISVNHGCWYNIGMIIKGSNHLHKLPALVKVLLVEV